MIGQVMDGAKIKIIDFFFNKESFTFSLNINMWIFLAIIGLFLFVRHLIKNNKEKSLIDKEIKLVKLKYKIGGTDFEYEISRNFQNVEIAHKIYIELITRKAAIEIDEEKDVIVEVYNSWYSLFQITRNELKSFKGKLLIENNTSQELVRLLTDILNKGLRPHLTEYQAKFRKWYDYQLMQKGNIDKSPQEIQKNFENIEELFLSMKNVNSILIDFSKQLKIIIEGKKTHSYEN